MNKDIKGFNGYSISINGVVFNGNTEAKTYIINANGKQYKAIRLIKDNGFNKTEHVHYIHRLVAKYWLNAPLNGQNIVQHKDGNTLNNKAFNLQWVSRSELKRVGNGRLGIKHSTQAKHNISKALQGANHPKYKGKYICEYKLFESATQAAKTFKIATLTVIRRCKNSKWRQKGWYFLPKNEVLQGDDGEIKS